MTVAVLKSSAKPDTGIPSPDERLRRREMEVLEEQLHQFPRVPDGQGTKEQGIDETENRRVGPYA